MIFCVFFFVFCLSFSLYLSHLNFSIPYDSLTSSDVRTPYMYLFVFVRIFFLLLHFGVVVSFIPSILYDGFFSFTSFLENTKRNPDIFSRLTLLFEYMFTLYKIVFVRFRWMCIGVVSHTILGISFEVWWICVWHAHIMYIVQIQMHRTGKWMFFDWKAVVWCTE